MVTEKLIGDYQCAFRPNKSTVDKHFVIRQMMESVDLHTLFVDFIQAFDGVNRKRLYEAIKQMKIPDKLIMLTRMAMNVTQARVKIDNKPSATF
jgi:hypothetical protein